MSLNNESADKRKLGLRLPHRGAWQCLPSIAQVTFAYRKGYVGRVGRRRNFRYSGFWSGAMSRRFYIENNRIHMHEEVRRAIGVRLRESRVSAGLSQSAVAKELGVQRQTVSAWECGESMPACAGWYSLGQLYGTSLDYLVYGIRTVPVSEYAVMASVFKPQQSKEAA